MCLRSLSRVVAATSAGWLLSPAGAAFLVQDDFPTGTPAAWQGQLGAHLEVVRTASTPSGLLVSGKTSFCGAVRNFPPVELKPGEKLKLDFELTYPAPGAPVDNGLRFGLIHNGEDGSATGRESVNDKGYGALVGLGTSAVFSLTQDAGTEGTAFGGKDSSGTLLTEGGGAKSGEAFTGLKAGQTTHFSLEVTRTPSGILLEGQAGQSFRSSQDKGGLQTAFNALAISNGAHKAEFIISKVRVEHFPAPVFPVAK